MTEEGFSIELIRKLLAMTSEMSDEQVLARKRLGLVIALPTSREIEYAIEHDETNPKNQKQKQKKGS